MLTLLIALLVIELINISDHTKIMFTQNFFVCIIEMESFFINTFETIYLNHYTIRYIYNSYCLNENK